jgi:hypothetical protein
LEQSVISDCGMGGRSPCQSQSALVFMPGFWGEVLRLPWKVMHLPLGMGMEVKIDVQS